MLCIDIECSLYYLSYLEEAPAIKTGVDGLDHEPSNPTAFPRNSAQKSIALSSDPVWQLDDHTQRRQRMIR